LSGDRALDLEHLQHGVEAGAAQVDDRLDGGHADGLLLAVQEGDHRLGVDLVREGRLDEPVLDVPVLVAPQQHDGGGVQGPPRPPDLLVVGDGRAR